MGVALLRDWDSFLVGGPVCLCLPGIVQVVKLKNLGNPLRTVNHSSGQNDDNRGSKGCEKAGFCDQHQGVCVCGGEGAAGGGKVGQIWEWRVGSEVKGPKGATLPGAWPPEALNIFFRDCKTKYLHATLNFCRSHIACVNLIFFKIGSLINMS